MNQKENKFKDFLVGEWRIENPVLQSFIRFEENGKTTYYFNQFSYRLDSLAEIGKWKLNEIRRGKEIDTFIVKIEKNLKIQSLNLSPLTKTGLK
jgi:hypothetical protein